MERLRARDQRRLFDYLIELYALRDHPAFVSHLVSSLGILLPCDRVSYNEFQSRPKSVRALWYPADVKLAKEMLPVFETYLHEHPIVPYLKKTGDGQAVRLSDLVSRREFRRTALYNEYYRPLGVQHQLGVSLAVSPSLLVPMALNRAGSDFSNAERAVFSLLGPHIAQAFRNAQAVTRAERERAALHQIVDQLDRGAMEVTARGKIIWATPHALASVKLCGQVRAHRLPEPLREWVARQMATFADPSVLPTPPEPLRIPKEGGHLHISCIQKGTTALLLFEEKTWQIETEQLVSLGLTRREAEVLRWIAEGKSNGDIAMLLGASVKTIKKHVEHILQKLGVESRLAAVTAVMTLAHSRRRSD